MGFWDRDVENGLDELFDYNRDGVLDPGEQAMEFDYMEKINNELNSTSSFDEEDEILDAIEGMDRDEAIEYLESEGYDADDFDL